MKRWVERLPSFAEFKTVEKEKETVVSGDQELVTALKVCVSACSCKGMCAMIVSDIWFTLLEQQARPPVIRDIRVRGILHANCFKGEVL